MPASDAGAEAAFKAEWDAFHGAFTEPRQADLEAARIGYLAGWSAHARSAAEKRDGEVERLRGALREITKREGPFSLDHLTHAANTIEAMAELAERALSPPATPATAETNDAQE